MPKTINGNPVDEEKWNKAKGLAKEQGHEGDYAYITGIYKRMVGIEKSFIIPNIYRGLRYPGQVPDRDAIDQVNKMPPTFTAKLLDNDQPILTVEAVTRNIGLPTDEQDDWSTYLKGMMDYDSDVPLRKGVFERCREKNYDGVLTRGIMARALKCYVNQKSSGNKGNLKKSNFTEREISAQDIHRIFSPETLEKAISHKYVRRVAYTDSKGRRAYRYYYRESAIARGATAGEDVRVGARMIKVLSVGKDRIKIKDGDTTRTLSHKQWTKLLADTYGPAFYKYQTKRARQAANAVLRHVPRDVLVDLKGDTDADRLADLKQRTPAIYNKLSKSFQRAGMNAIQGKTIITDTLKRKGWEPEARAVMIGSVLTEGGAKRVVGYRDLLDGAENLAGKKKVTKEHAQTAVDLGNANVAKIAKRAEKELLKLKQAIQTAKKAGGDSSAVLNEVMGSKNMQALLVLAQAFPGVKDKAIEPVRKAVLGAPSVIERSPTTEGSHTGVILAGEGGKPVTLKAQYKLVEASDVIASHSPEKGFKPNQQYPEGVQERAYHRDVGEQDKVRRNAKRFDSRFVVNTNPDAVNGPPMVTPEGVVLGGNSRTMSMQTAYHSHPEKAAEIRKYLEDHAHEVGLQAQDVQAMKNPVLVRVVEVEDKSKENMQLLVRQMNESFTQAMDPRTMQVAMARKLDSRALDSLTSTIGEDETLNQYLRSNRSKGFTDNLRRIGVIDERNFNQYFNKSGKLTQDGVTLISRLLAGKVLDDADLLSETRPGRMNALAGAVPYLVRASGSGEGYNLSEPMKTALSALNRLQDKIDVGHLKPLDAKMSDRDIKVILDNEFQDMFGDRHPVLDDSRAQDILRLFIKKPGPNQLRSVFKEYASLAAKNPEGQGGLFGSRSPHEVFKASIESATKKEAVEKSMKYVISDLEKSRNKTPIGGKTAGGYTVKLIGGKRVYEKDKPKDTRQLGLFTHTSKPKPKPKAVAKIPPAPPTKDGWQTIKASALNFTQFESLRDYGLTGSEIQWTESGRRWAFRKKDDEGFYLYRQSKDGEWEFLENFGFISHALKQIEPENAKVDLLLREDVVAPVQEPKQVKRYSDKEATKELTAIGNDLVEGRLYNPDHPTKLMFSKHDKKSWKMIRGNLGPMRQLLSKYENQITTSLGGDAIYKLGLDRVVKPKPKPKPKPKAVAKIPQPKVEIPEIKHKDERIPELKLTIDAEETEDAKEQQKQEKPKKKIFVLDRTTGEKEKKPPTPQVSWDDVDTTPKIETVPKSYQPLASTEDKEVKAFWNPEYKTVMIADSEGQRLDMTLYKMPNKTPQEILNWAKKRLGPGSESEPGWDRMPDVEPAKTEEVIDQPEKEKPKKKAKKKKEEIPQERYTEEEAIEKLSVLGDTLWQIQREDPNERDASGFNSSDMKLWDRARGDIDSMRHILKKYKRQISAIEDSPEEYHKMGLSDRIVNHATKIKAAYHSTDGSLSLPTHGSIKHFDEYLAINKKHGARWYGRNRYWYVPKHKLAELNFAGYQADMDKIGITVHEPAGGIRTPEPPKKEEAGKPPQLTAREAAEAIRSKRVRDTIAVTRDEDGKFTFFSTFSETFKELFSNKTGKLTGITRVDPKTWGRETYDLDLVEEALEKIKASMPEFNVITEGIKEANIERDQYLADLQKPIPSVQEKLSEKFKLFPYQNEGVRFLDKTDGKALIGDEMGLGKTLQTLAWAAKNNKKVLIVCPKIVRRTWIQEAEKFFPDHFVGTELVAADLRKKKPIDLSGVNIATVNYESLAKFEDKIKAAGFDTIVIDESHRIKNPKAKVTQTVTRVGSKLPHKILLSGTAVINKRSDLVSQLDLIDKDKYTEMKTVENPYSGAISHKKGLKEETIGGNWLAMRNVYLARQKKNVLKDLPDKTTSIVSLKIPNLPDVEVDKGGNKVFTSIGEYQELKTALAVEKTSATKDMVQEILDSSDSSVLVFSESKRAAKKLKEMFGDKAVLHTGDTSDNEREVIKDEFQKQDEFGNFISKKRVFIATRGSMYAGATLTAADKVVFNDLPWTASNLRQAEDRAHRLGQKKAVNVYWVTGQNNLIDQNISEIIFRKYTLAKKSAEGKQLTPEEREWMDKELSKEELLSQIKGKTAGPTEQTSSGNDDDPLAKSMAHALGFGSVQNNYSDLNKSKFLSKRPDGKGGWYYRYEEPESSKRRIEPKVSEKLSAKAGKLLRWISGPGSVSLIGPKGRTPLYQKYGESALKELRRHELIELENPIERRYAITPKGRSVMKEFGKSVGDSDLEKAHKYVRRWKNKKGEWEYEYPKNQGSKGNFVGPNGNEQHSQPSSAKEKSHVDEIVKEAKQLVERHEDDYDRFGLRVIPDGHEVNSGDVLDSSYVWDDGEKTEEELPGTSTLTVSNRSAKLLNLYSGGQVVLVGGDFEEYGEDDEELVISNATVLKTWSITTKKSLTLEKAQSPGGKYYRRVPRKSGNGHTYYYSADDYNKRKDAHPSGEDNERNHINTKIDGCLESAGKDGCPVAHFKDLVKKYGAKKVGKCLRASCDSGTLQHKKGKFYRKNKTQGEEKK